MVEITKIMQLAQIISILREVGLALNEARIFAVLLESGESSVSSVAASSGIHRRNVYDSLNRLIEKGLVFEILQGRENLYQAVDPNKLAELVDERRVLLGGIMPQLRNMYTADPVPEQVAIYRGTEGWKQYMRDILRVREDFYCIGGKGAWMDARLRHFFPRFIKEAARSGISHYHFFDREVLDSGHPIVGFVGEQYKFLPPEFSTPCSIDCFGDHVNIVSSVHLGGVEDDLAFTVICDRGLADSVRTWFRFMWDHFQG